MSEFRARLVDRDGNPLGTASNPIKVIGTATQPTVNEFIELIDCPTSYEGHSGKTIVVNAIEKAMEFATVTMGTGDVIGPNGAVADNLVSFNGATGKSIKDSGYAPTDFPTKGGTPYESWTIDTDGSYPATLQVSTLVDGSLNLASGCVFLGKLPATYGADSELTDRQFFLYSGEDRIETFAQFTGFNFIDSYSDPDASEIWVCHEYENIGNWVRLTADDDSGEIVLGQCGTPTYIIQINSNPTGSYIDIDRHRVWHAGNDGSGSGLDADTLDTYHATSFASATHLHHITDILVDILTLPPSHSGGHSGVADFSTRLVLPATLVLYNSDSVRFQVKGPLQASHFAIGKRFGLTSTTNAIPIEITFNGGTSGVVLADGVTAWSDWIPYEMNTTTSYLLIVDVIVGPYSEGSDWVGGGMYWADSYTGGSYDSTSMHGYVGDYSTTGFFQAFSQIEGKLEQDDLDDGKAKITTGDTAGYLYDKLKVATAEFDVLIGATQAPYNETMWLSLKPNTVASYTHTHPATQVELLKLGTTTYDDAQDWVNIVQSGGRISGATLSAHAPANGTLDISALTGFIKCGDLETATTKYFDFATQTSVALTDNNINYVYLDYNAGTPRVLVTTDRTTIRVTDQFTLGRAFRQTDAVEVMQSGINTPNRTRRIHERWVDTFGGLAYANGIITSCTGLKPAFNAGTLYAGSNKIPIAAKDCNTSGTFTRYYYNPTTALWVKTASQTTLDNTQYNKTDTGTGLATLTNTSRYAVHWLYVCPEGSMYVLMGQGDYTLTQAQGISAPILCPNYLTQWAKLAAKIIIQKSASTVYSITLAWSTQFPVQTAGDHNGLAGLQGGTTDQYYHLTSSEQTDLAALAAVADSVGLLKKTAANTWTIDTSTYLTANQSISLSGDVTGTGTTSISTTLATVATAGTYRSVTVNVKGLVTAGTGITNVTGATQAMAINSEYIANNATVQCVLTLPSVAAVGDRVVIIGAGAGGWKVAQNASQQIVYGSKSTTIGTGGYMYSNSQYESLSLLCITANTLFTVIRPTGEPWMV